MPKRKSLTYTFQAEELALLKTKMLNWLRPFSIFAYLDNNGYIHQPNRFELLIGTGAEETFQYPDIPAGDWLFGHAAYDLKNEIIPQLTSRHKALTGFADSFFFRPAIVAYIATGSYILHIESLTQDPAFVLNDILGQKDTRLLASAPQNIAWRLKPDKAAYLGNIKSIREHIAEGDCYELNFCVEAFCTGAELDPYETFSRLNKLNPSPFAALYRNENAYCICASPERFLYKENRQILSQPIKGTIRKGKNEEENESLKMDLIQDEKERAENVMIVDLVRNDLARCCVTGSVKVPELFGVYTFPQLFHLISTVSGQLQKNKTFPDILEVTFPMGSMTGAPKRIVMELIEAYEVSRRGLYSGTIGYIMPEGNFDFNVVIRSLFYNAATHRLSYQAGGAITWDSIPEKEWEEVQLKAKAMEALFQ
jgi:para-aminobenzoate synthetase component 1